MNMSYCMYQNTSLNLSQCLNDLEERSCNNGKNECGEKLSSDEKRALKKLVSQCQDLIDCFEEDEEDL